MKGSSPPNALDNSQLRFVNVIQSTFCSDVTWWWIPRQILHLNEHFIPWHCIGCILSFLYSNGLVVRKPFLAMLLKPFPAAASTSLRQLRLDSFIPSASLCEMFTLACPLSSFTFQSDTFLNQFWGCPNAILSDFGYVIWQWSLSWKSFTNLWKLFCPG